MTDQLGDQSDAWSSDEQTLYDEVYFICQENNLQKLMDTKLPKKYNSAYYIDDSFAAFPIGHDCITYLFINSFKYFDEWKKYASSVQRTLENYASANLTIGWKLFDKLFQHNMLIVDDYSQLLSLYSTYYANIKVIEYFERFNNFNHELVIEMLSKWVEGSTIKNSHYDEVVKYIESRKKAPKSYTKKAI